MRVLLIRGNSSSSSVETNITGIYPPLGLAYIASALRDAGYHVSLLDNHILRLHNNSLQSEIKRIAPDVALLSSMTPSWPGLIALSRLIKDILPQTIIGAGGPHLSVYPKESLSYKTIDFGVYGEGELTILEILRKIQEAKGLDEVKGVIFRKNGKIIVNSPRGEIDNLDSVPFPAIDLLPYKRYVALLVKNPFFTMVTSRGCPYHCNFCFQGYLGSYRARSPENVVEEIEILVNKYKIREIITFDETFAVEEERALKICELIRKKRLSFKWDIRTRVDLLSRDLLKSFRSAGASRIHLGIESGNQDILKRMRKGIDISEIIEKINLAKRIGFELRGYFMLGFPGETRRSICRTIEFAKSLPLDWASFTVTIGLPGTEIYRDAVESGYFCLDYWREYTKGNNPNAIPYFIPEGLKENDLFALKRKAYLEFYLRPKIVWSMLRSLKSAGLRRNFNIFLKLAPPIFNSIARV